MSPGYPFPTCTLPRPAPPRPALPCPALPRPAPPLTHVICVHFKVKPMQFQVSVCSAVCEKLQQAFKQNVPCKSCLYFISSQSQEATRYLCSCSRALSNHTAEELYVTGIYGQLVHSCTIPRAPGPALLKQAFRSCTLTAALVTSLQTLLNHEISTNGWSAHEMST